MKLRIGHFGKITNKDVQNAGLEYQKRTTRFIQIEDFEYKANVAGHDKRTSSRNKNAIVSFEDSDFVVLLDEHGTSFTSETFAKTLQTHLDNPRFKRLIFLVGPPYGFDEATKAKAHLTLSLSTFVIPSDLAWLLICEQIYRAFNILNQTPYHHA